jgi:hypothetical protein
VNQTKNPAFEELRFSIIWGKLAQPTHVFMGSWEPGNLGLKSSFLTVGIAGHPWKVTAERHLIFKPLYFHFAHLLPVV